MAAELQWHSRVREKGSHVAFCPLRAAAAHWEQERRGGGGKEGVLRVLVLAQPAGAN